MEGILDQYPDQIKIGGKQVYKNLDCSPTKVFEGTIRAGCSGGASFLGRLFRPKFSRRFGWGRKERQREEKATPNPKVAEKATEATPSRTLFIPRS